VNCRDRSAAPVRGQAGNRRAFQQKRQQLGLRKDARHQLAIFQVVPCKGRLVLVEAALDFIHALIGIVDRLAFAQYGTRYIFEAERRETPCGGAQRFDTVDDQSSRGACEEMVLFVTVLAPFHHCAAAAEPQRHAQLFGVLLQHTQIELHQIPADDRVGVVPFQPRVQFFEQLCAGFAVFEVEVDTAAIAIFTVWRSEHIDLTLSAPFERDGIELGVRAGFDIERHQLQ
jgi:hypothetical protein